MSKLASVLKWYTRDEFPARGLLGLRLGHKVTCVVQLGDAKTMCLCRILHAHAHAQAARYPAIPERRAPISTGFMGTLRPGQVTSWQELVTPSGGSSLKCRPLAKPLSPSPSSRYVCR